MPAISGDFKCSCRPLCMIITLICKPLISCIVGSCYLATEHPCETSSYIIIMHMAIGLQACATQSSDVHGQFKCMGLLPLSSSLPPSTVQLSYVTVVSCPDSTMSLWMPEEVPYTCLCVGWFMERAVV